MTSVDKYLAVTQYAIIYTLTKSLYIDTSFYRNHKYEMKNPIVAFGDNVPVKFKFPNKNLQELFNRDYGLENLYIKIDYNNPYQILEIK